MKYKVQVVSKMSNFYFDQLSPIKSAATLTRPAGSVVRLFVSLFVSSSVMSSVSLSFVLSCFNLTMVFTVNKFDSNTDPVVCLFCHKAIRIIR